MQWQTSQVELGKQAVSQQEWPQGPFMLEGELPRGFWHFEGTGQEGKGQ